MFVKICGITRREDAQLAASLGAAAVGFVLWHGSRRVVEPERARAIVDGLPPHVLPVGVFVNEERARLEQVARRAGVRAVQLHGEESAQYCREMTLPVFKAVPLGGGAGPAVARHVPGRCTVLVDACDGVQRGGTGLTADWEAAREIARERQVVLAGGLNAANVAAAIRHVRPWGVDVSSGVESAPGIKDASRMRTFFEAVDAALRECEQ